MRLGEEKVEWLLSRVCFLNNFLDMYFICVCFLFLSFTIVSARAIVPFEYTFSVAAT